MTTTKNTKSATKSATTTKKVAKKTTTKKVAKKATTKKKVATTATKKATTKKATTKKATTTKKVATKKVSTKSATTPKKKVVRKKKAFTKAIFDLSKIKSQKELEKTLESGYNSAMKGDCAKLENFLVKACGECMDADKYTFVVDSMAHTHYRNSDYEYVQTKINRNGVTHFQDGKEISDPNWVKTFYERSQNSWTKEKESRIRGFKACVTVGNGYSGIDGTCQHGARAIKSCLASFAGLLWSSISYKRALSNKSFLANRKKALGLNENVTDYRWWCEQHLLDCLKNGVHGKTKITLRNEDRVHCYTGSIDGVELYNGKLLVDIYIQSDHTDTDDCLDWSEFDTNRDTHYYQRDEDAGYYGGKFYDESFRMDIDTEDKQMFYKKVYEEAVRMFENGEIR